MISSLLYMVEFAWIEGVAGIIGGELSYTLAGPNGLEQSPDTGSGLSIILSSEVKLGDAYDEIGFFGQWSSGGGLRWSWGSWSSSFVAGYTLFANRDIHLDIRLIEWVY